MRIEAYQIKWFENEVNKVHVHGKNILAKIKKYKKLKGNQQKELKKIVIPAYKRWKERNETLKGYTKDKIKKRVNSLNVYKEEIKDVPFSPQSKFHSSVIEEFLYYLFRDLIEDINSNASREQKTKIMLGGARAYTNLYFAPQNLPSFLEKANMRINVKDQDFAIYRQIQVQADSESNIINVPVVSIECKTFIDKTMLEGSIATAEKIKNGNPYCLFLIVTERYDVSYNVDPAYSRIDQIYVLRKQKRKTNHDKPIDSNVVLDFFGFVKKHLETEWSNIDEKLKKEGKII